MLVKYSQVATIILILMLSNVKYIVQRVFFVDHRVRLLNSVSNNSIKFGTLIK